MSDIVLSASVRQNLLSLQSTADLLATTQQRLSTGKKVNSALENPTNFFTASGLDARAGEIGRLLDGINNGVQVLQAANTGITSLQKLVDTAKSIGNQALQTSLGYAKSTVSSAAIKGATSSNLLGGPSNATKSGGTVAGLTTATLLNATPPGMSVGDSITVNGQTITFTASGSTNSITATGASISIGSTVQTLLDAIDTITGTFALSSASTVSSNQIVLSTGVAQDLTVGGNATILGKLGLAGIGTVNRADVLSNKTLFIGQTGSTGVPTNITFGKGVGQISNLTQLNTELAKNNLQATIDSNGVLTITTTTDYASAKIGASGAITGISSTATEFTGLTVNDSVADANSQATRANLVTQYNNIISQIMTTAQDASFNGVNLLNGDTLKLVFNETGRSTLTINGAVFSPSGLGLSTLTAGTDFIDNAQTNKVLAALNTASSTLRSQASALGSNLSVVQIRQEFAKSLINVLQTGSANLIIADTNEEAANSQALSTRQSIAVSALSLANQSQQSVLQLLR